MLLQEFESRTFVTIAKKTECVVILPHDKAVERKVDTFFKHAAQYSRNDIHSQEHRSDQGRSGG